jgi:hypothetical protein
MDEPGRPADVFAAELHRHRTERPRPLPVHLRPLATAIVGDRPVNLATGPASRRALAKVGKVAATTGSTIHVNTARPSTEVIAHELTHVAHPSPVARFFDDDDRSPEERQAEQVAAVMRRAPVVRNTPVLQRAARSASASSTVSAEALASSVTGGGVVQRKQTIGGHRARATATPTTPSQTPTQVTQAPTVAQTTETSTTPATAPSIAPSMDAQFERILELLEDRILAELERRGGRLRGGF